MECVAFEYVLDFELEKPTSTKSLEMQYWLQMKGKLFAVLPMVSTCGVLLDTVTVIRFKSNEKYSCYF